MTFYHQESLAEQASRSLQLFRSEIELCDTLLTLPIHLFGLTWLLPTSPAKPPAASSPIAFKCAAAMATAFAERARFEATVNNCNNESKCLFLYFPHRVSVALQPSSPSTFGTLCAARSCRLLLLRLLLHSQIYVLYRSLVAVAIKLEFKNADGP